MASLQQVQRYRANLQGEIDGAAMYRVMAELEKQPQRAEIYRRLVGLPRAVPEESRHLVSDLVNQFDRIAGLAGEEKEYLQGVIEFYRTRTETKMTIAAERLAVIAVVTLPITALASVLGMNMIVNSHTVPIPLTIALTDMVAMSAGLLWWAKRQGWW